MVWPLNTSAACSPPQPASSTARANKNEAQSPVPVAAGGRRSATKVIQQNVVPLHAEVEQHLDAGSVHHRRTAHVELAILRGRMVLQVLLVQHVVDEAGKAAPVVLRLGIGQGQVPLEVGVLRRQFVVFLGVEALAKAAGAVPEGDLAVGLEPAQLVEDV